jgi:glycogenin glucosyltransferase
MKCSYFTLATDDFIPGVICLAKSLKRLTSIPLYCLGLNLSLDSKEKLKSVGCKFVETSYLGSKTSKFQPYRENPNFANNAYNKIHLWSQDFDKIIYFDADIVVLKNTDHIFDMDIDFGASPTFQMIFNRELKKYTSMSYNYGYFNSGVLVLKPSIEIFNDMLAKKDVIHTPNDPSDQGFLNHYFKDKWWRLDPIYNYTRRVFDVHPANWQKLKSDVCVLHFTLEKPWKKRENTEINKIWWDINDS